MCKSLYLEPGHLARCGDLWYEPGILLIVEAHERVEVYTARNGMPAIRRGSFGYAELDPRQLPTGLRSAQPVIDTRPHGESPMRNATRTAARPACASQLRRRRRAALLLARGLNSDGRIAYRRNVLQVFGWIGSDAPGISGGVALSTAGRA